jgi:hypothetical protein
MKKSIAGSILFIGFLCNFANAQQKFTGLIEYKLTSFKKDKERNQPNKVTILYGKDKKLAKLFGEEDGSDWVLINTITDSIYMISSHAKIYERESLMNDRGGFPELKKTDSFKTFFGHRCRGYTITDVDNQFAGYSWMAEDLSGITGKDTYNSAIYRILGAQYVMMSMEVYEKGKRDALVIAESITRMETVPDSLFDISGFKYGGGGEPDATMAPDSARMIGPADTAYAVTTETLPVVQIAGKDYKKAPSKRAPTKKPGVKARKPKPAAVKPKKAK